MIKKKYKKDQKLDNFEAQVSLLQKPSKENYAGAFFKLYHIIIHRSKSIYPIGLVNTILDCKFCCSLNLMRTIIVAFVEEAEQYAFEKSFFIFTLKFSIILCDLTLLALYSKFFCFLFIS